MCSYSYGIFRLTEPGGLTTIINCRHSALFHEHPDIKGGIYTDADHGHVRLTSSLPPLEVIDLRRK
jgi:STAM-binding protein